MLTAQGQIRRARLEQSCHAGFDTSSSWRGRSPAGWLTSERLSGTVTFLFTDIEGSTGLLKQLGRARYGELLADQQRLLRERSPRIGARRSTRRATRSSSPSAARRTPSPRRSTIQRRWPLTNGPRARGARADRPPLGRGVGADERYVGFASIARRASARPRHGGQVLVSDSTRALVEDDLAGGVFLRDLGRHRLKDIDRPERISQARRRGTAGRSSHRCAGPSRSSPRPSPPPFACWRRLLV